MQHPYDPVAAFAALPRRRRWNLWLALALILMFAVSMSVYAVEATRESADIAMHAGVAADFDFTDLHSITSRTTYPVWHLLTSTLYQLGMPLHLAAGAVTAMMKCLTLLFVYWLLSAMAGESVRPGWIIALSFCILMVSSLRIPSLNPNVYRFAGRAYSCAPNVWHNPTQPTVIAAMMLVMPWLCHCWYCFEAAVQEGQECYLLPWGKVFVLAVLTTGSAVCKPTFLQALLPAAFVMYLAELIRRPKQWRYFGQIVLGFLPSVGYFLLSYLYFTGVVVEFTSGVEVYFDPDMLINLLLGQLVMGAAPIVALAACWRRGMLKDRLLLLTLLMILFSVAEGCLFHETGLRVGHGNFTWAASSSAFLLWATAASVLMREKAAGHLASRPRRAALWASAGLLIYHLASAIYYLSVIIFYSQMPF